MMPKAAPSVLILPALLFTGCASTPELAEQGSRPGDFTLGLVVYHDQPWADAAHRPARYIVEPDGTLRASIGDGSIPLTHPPITRRLDQAQLDRLWGLTSALFPSTADGAADGDGGLVRSPETYVPARGDGYLVEVRSRDNQSAWALGLDDEDAQGLAAELAGLAWVRP